MIKTSLLSFFPSLRENPDREKGEKKANQKYTYLYPSPANWRDYPNQGRTKKLKVVLYKQNSIEFFVSLTAMPLRKVRWVKKTDLKLKYQTNFQTL